MVAGCYRRDVAMRISDIQTKLVRLIQESRGGEYPPFCHCITVWVWLPFTVSSWLYLNTCVKAAFFQIHLHIVSGLSVVAARYQLLGLSLFLS